jgi:hypothetical protein
MYTAVLQALVSKYRLAGERLGDLHERPSEAGEGIRPQSIVAVQKNNRLAGRRRYPLVLMLEPLFRCNLACAGCGKIDYPEETLKRRLSVEQALAAVDECGAPIVSIPGGEPLIHTEMPQIGRV